jgi:hypothetical protein
VSLTEGFTSHFFDGDLGWVVDKVYAKKMADQTLCETRTSRRENQSTETNTIHKLLKIIFFKF